jgi:hypothetical protein
MAEILGVGISHWPRLRETEDTWAMRLRAVLREPDLPVRFRDPAAWPEQMRAEWGADQGVAAAAPHREALLRGLRRVRSAIDAFDPEVVVIWGDDQYENFREDVIPPFCILGYQDDVVARPFGAAPNPWGETAETAFTIKTAPHIAKALAGGLIEESFDVAYAYRPLHYPGLSHAFINAVLYLDYDRTGFPYPVIPITVNCYGSYVISRHGRVHAVDHADDDPDPPAPSPARCFDLGRATARVLRSSPWRAVLVASSSWSHAFLCDKNWHLYPDIPSDRRLYDALVAGDYGAWRETPLAAVVDAGQQELLNWFCLMGAMSELNQRLEWSEFVAAYIFVSNKVAAVFGG